MHYIDNKKNNYVSLQILCLSICILFIGFFNDFALINPDSAMFRSPSVFFMWASVLLFIAHGAFGGKMLRIKFRAEHFWLSLFLVWAIISTILNIYQSSYIHSTKINGLSVITNGLRFYLLIATFILSVVSLQTSQDRIIYKLSKFFLYSFFLTIPYSILELLSYVLHIDLARTLLNSLDLFLHARRGDDYLDFDRVRGLAFEPSYYGVYISTILPFIIAMYSLSKVKIYYKALILFLILCVIYSQSRTAYVAILFEMIIFYYLKRRYSPGSQPLFSIKNIILASTLIALFLTMGDESIISITYQSLVDPTLSSNISRGGGQHAGFLVGLDNPFFGVGPGMAGAHVHNYYPEYMFLSEEIYIWISSGLTDLSAPTFGFFSTLAAELGLCGLTIFLIALTVISNKLIKTIQISSLYDVKYSTYGIAIASSTVGIYISSFGLNGMTYVGYWILLSIALLYNRNI